MASVDFNWLTTGLFSATPILILLIIAIFIGIIAYMYKQKIGPFYWRGAMSAPCVFNIENGVKEFVQGGDRIRVTEEGQEPKMVKWESRCFKDKFAAGNLTRLVKWVGGVRGHYEVAPIDRIDAGVWGPHPVLANSQTLEEEIRAVREAKQALGIMRKGNTAQLGEDWLVKYMPLISVVLMGIILLISMIVVMQFMGAAFNTHVQSLNENTQALAQLINATVIHPSPTPIRPPG